jgi:hypothetical protein
MFLVSFKNRHVSVIPRGRGVGMTATARKVAAATRQRQLTLRVRHIYQLSAIIFCSLAPSLLHHSANAGHCSRTAEASCSVVACGCTGCHGVHGDARITQKGSLCRRQHACVRTSRRICTPTSTLPSLRYPASGCYPAWPSPAPRMCLYLLQGGVVCLLKEHYKAVRCVCLLLQDLVQRCLHGGGGGYGRTCATRDDEPRPVCGLVCPSRTLFVFAWGETMRGETETIRRSN